MPQVRLVPSLSLPVHRGDLRGLGADLLHELRRCEDFDRVPLPQDPAHKLLPLVGAEFDVHAAVRPLLDDLLAVPGPVQRVGPHLAGKQQLHREGFSAVQPHAHLRVKVVRDPEVPRKHENLVRDRQFPHPPERKDAYVTLVVVAAQHVPVAPLADGVIGVQLPLHICGLFQRPVVKAERMAGLERVEHGLEAIRAYRFCTVGDEGDFGVQEGSVHGDPVGQAGGDLGEHGAQLLFQRGVAVLLEQGVHHGDGECLALGQGDALDEEVRLGVAVALPARLNGGVQAVAHEFYVALDGPGVVAAVLNQPGNLLGGEEAAALEDAVYGDDAPPAYLCLPGRTMSELS